jgi:type 1 glutamine amidotransferase
VRRIALRFTSAAALFYISLCVSAVQGQDSQPTPKRAAQKADQKVSFPRKIVLLAGPRDGKHPAGAHEYDTTVRTIKDALESSNIADKVKVELHTNGWPEDPATLDDADAIFIASAGADHSEAAHPLLVGDRLAVLGRQMDRGCGLVMIHWSLFVPIKHEKEFLRWVGGFFDYQRGDDPRGWHSDITFATAKVDPNDDHPIGKGVPPFEHRDEYYYNIRFRKTDARLTPVVTVKLPEVEKPQVVAWAVERKDGGRGFAFTGGHFQNSWENDAYRTLMLNALCWTAKVPIPAGGIHKQLAFDDQWTPKRHLGKGDLPAEKEEDWVDARIRESDTGPFFTASIAVPPPGSDPSEPKDTRKAPLDSDMVVKALAIKLGGKDGLPPAGVLFDKERVVLRCGWTGGFLNHSDRRFGLLEKPTIAGELAWSTPSDAAWLVSSSDDAARPNNGDQAKANVEYRGLHLSGDRVVLDYSVAGCEVRESFSWLKAAESGTLVRIIRHRPTERPLVLPLGGWPGVAPREIARDWMFPRTGDLCCFEKDGQTLAIGLAPRMGGYATNGVHLRNAEGGISELVVPPARHEQEYCIVYWQGPAERLDDLQAQVFNWVYDCAGKDDDESKPRPPTGSLEIPSDPAPRWGKPLVTKGVIGSPEPGSPFAVDTVTIPYENPSKALFFTSGFDFTPDGACYVCTAHGDVWKVTGIDDDLDEVRWQRFATGLYEALGVKVRDGDVFVLGRDQVTRLHDENGDGEADYYECFNDDLTDRGESHAYAMCLEADAAGNFYFLKSGAPSTPHGGTLLKLSADGKDLEVFATGFRHPNGMSVGPDGTVTAADNEGNWVPVTRVDVVEKGDFCGHVPTAHLDPEPADCGLPLCWLPRVVDNSAGGQVWVPEGAWGPLAGRLLHLSYGRCTANLILKEQVDGVWQGGAIPLLMPRFLSGVCRARFRTAGEGADGYLYVCGLDGWSTEAEADGCLQRVRYVGGPLRIPTDLGVHENGIELTFPEPLDPAVASNPARYAVDIWNYRWSKDYGSEDYSVADPTRIGRDSLPLTAATVSDDGRSVFLQVDGLKPVMQLRVQAGLRSANGATLPVDYYGTVHRLRSASSGFARSAAAAKAS